MIKMLSLRKELIKYSIIMLVAVSVSGALAYGIHAWSSGLQEEAQRAKSQLASAEREVSSREMKNQDARTYLELYRRITGDSEQAKISDLRRERAQTWLKEAARENHILNLEGSFDPVVPIESEPFRKKTLQGINSLVKLKFAAMTDEQIYNFLEAITTTFPGYVKVTKFTLERTGDITDSVLQAAERGRFPTLVTGTMEFYWIGVREVAADEQQDGPARTQQQRRR